MVRIYFCNGIIKFTLDYLTHLGIFFKFLQSKIDLEVKKNRI